MNSKRKAALVGLAALSATLGTALLAYGGTRVVSRVAPASAERRAILDPCSGTYTCTVESTGRSGTSRLRRAEGACWAGEVKLEADGVATSDEVHATWSAERDAFRLCVGRAPDSQECMRCAAPAPAIRPEPELRAALVP